MRIGIDIDGVLNDVGYWHYTYGFKYCIEMGIDRGFDPYSYLIEEQFKLTDEENDDFWNTYIYDLLESIPVRPYASYIIGLLRDMGHKIVIVSARNDRYLNNGDMFSYVSSWLDKNNILYDEIIIGNGNKKDKCIDNNIDIMIEDKLDNVIDISSVIPVLCFDAPYNRDINSSNVTRVYSWFHIYNYFLSIEKK